MTRERAQAEPHRQLGSGLGQLGFRLKYALAQFADLPGDVLGLCVGRQPRLFPGQPQGLTIGHLALEHLTQRDSFRFGVRRAPDQCLILDLQLLPPLPFLLVSSDIYSIHMYAAPN